MSETLRRIVGIVVAMVVAGGVVMLVDAFAVQLHPLPPGADPRDPETIKTALEAGAIPFASLGLMAAGWLLAAYVGGTVAARIGRWGGSVWAFAALFTFGTYANLASLPHPTWMWIVGCAGCPLFALAAGNQSVSVPTGT